MLSTDEINLCLFVTSSLLSLLNILLAIIDVCSIYIICILTLAPLLFSISENVCPFNYLSEFLLLCGIDVAISSLSMHMVTTGANRSSCHCVLSRVSNLNGKIGLRYMIMSTLSEICKLLVKTRAFKF